jgi:hypothetical protein
LGVRLFASGRESKISRRFDLDDKDGDVVIEDLVLDDEIGSFARC